VINSPVVGRLSLSSDDEQTPKVFVAATQECTRNRLGWLHTCYQLGW